MSLSTKLSAQNTDMGMWYLFVANQNLPKKLNLHYEVQYRNYNAIGDLEQLLLRTGIGYQPHPDVNILAGYAYIHARPYDATGSKFSQGEHRPFQQIVLKHKYDRVYTQHRYRIEERLLPGNFKLRFRYFLGLNIPFNKPQMEKKAFYLSLYDELFIQAQKNAFDRNRLYGALGYVLNKHLKLEVGAMTQMRPNGSRAQGQIALFANDIF